MNTISRAMLITSTIIGIFMSLIGMALLIMSLFAVVSLPPVAEVSTEENLEALLYSWQSIRAAVNVGAIGVVWGAIGAAIIAFAGKIYK